MLCPGHLCSGRRQTYILRDVVEDRDAPHVLPVIVLGEDEGQDDDHNQGHEEAEAPASQGGPNLLQGGGVEVLVLQVGGHQPGCYACELAGEGSCTKATATHSMVVR